MAGKGAFRTSVELHCKQPNKVHRKGAAGIVGYAATTKGALALIGIRIATATSFSYTGSHYFADSDCYCGTAVVWRTYADDGHAVTNAR